MGWATPKTDWKETDFFIYADYNRIKNNIQFLWEMSVDLYMDFKIGDMGADRSEEEYPYADEINMMSDNLDQIVGNIFPLDIGTKTVYEDNREFIGWEDLNRIESATLKIYTLLQEQKENKPRLLFRLGNIKGVKC